MTPTIITYLTQNISRRGEKKGIIKQKAALPYRQSEHIHIRHMKLKSQSKSFTRKPGAYETIQNKSLGKVLKLRKQFVNLSGGR